MYKTSSNKTKSRIKRKKIDYSDFSNHSTTKAKKFGRKKVNRKTKGNQLIKKVSFWQKPWVKLGIGVASIIVLMLGVVLYFIFFFDNVVEEKKAEIIYIPSGSDYESVISLLEKENKLKNNWTFKFTANLLKYPKLVKPGRYKIPASIGNYKLVHYLRIGRQDPVNVSFVGARTKEKLAEKFDAKLEMSAQDFLDAINDPAVLDSLNLTVDNVTGIFIPNTYNIYWNVKPKKLIYQMKASFDKFWTEDKVKKAKDLNLTPMQVVILASIVQEETIKEDEKPRVAGVYLNRLRNNWKLQADPTVKFALQDFSLRRIYHRHLKYDSPYNTYMYEGLPPGPIACPSTTSINAVLNPEQHDYFYFCARSDFSGYHSFAGEHELGKHERNADNYASKLNELKIE